MSLIADVIRAFKCKCPVCGQGRLFDKSLNVRPVCESCGADLAANDIGDGAVVFIIFILGFVLAPLAWFVDIWLSPPLWVHAVVWTVAALVMAIGLLPVVKSYIMLLQCRYRPGSWKKED